MDPRSPDYVSAAQQTSEPCYTSIIGPTICMSRLITADFVRIGTAPRRCVRRGARLPGGRRGCVHRFQRTGRRCPARLPVMGSCSRRSRPCMARGDRHRIELIRIPSSAAFNHPFVVLFYEVGVNAGWDPRPLMNWRRVNPFVFIRRTLPVPVRGPLDSHRESGGQDCEAPLWGWLR